MHSDDLKVFPISAFTDNYIWLMANSKTKCAVVVDPGDATPVLQALTKHNLKLSAILITHHHADHTGGVADILNNHKVPVYQPNSSEDGAVITIDEIQLRLKVIATPGHTLDHIVYYGNNKLFCGDTLFAGGCGRLFEGTPAQMLQSLQKIAALPPNTEVYCAHEYTQANLRFALAVEPDNQELIARVAKVNALRDNSAVTLPSSIELELATNPFLRVNNATIRRSAAQFCKQKLLDDLAVFSVLRKWKDNFV